MIQSSGHTNPKDNARPEPKNISPPVQCRTCSGQFYIFDMPGHPDDQEVFACGVMLENMRENGSRPFPCAYRQAPALSAIIDAENYGDALRAVKERRARG